MQTNRDLATGHRHTYYRVGNIKSEVLVTLLSVAVNLTIKEAHDEEFQRQRADWERRAEETSVQAQDAGQPPPVIPDFVPDWSDFRPDISKPEFEGIWQNVHFRVVWHFGRQLLGVMVSPIIGHFQLHPTIPGATDGSVTASARDGYPGFAVPPDWLAEDPTRLRRPLRLDNSAEEA